MRPSLMVGWIGFLCVGCAAPSPVRPRPNVGLVTRSVHDEDTGRTTSEWRVEVGRTGADVRAWLQSAGGAPWELQRAGEVFSTGHASAGEGDLITGRRLTVLVQDEDGEVRATALVVPATPSGAALEGLSHGPDGPRIRWRWRGGTDRCGLVVRDGATGAVVFAAEGAGARREELLPANALGPGRDYVVELRARSERGQLVVENVARRTLTAPRSPRRRRRCARRCA